MIPVKIIKAIYIRKGPGVSFPYLGVIYPSGNEISMAGTVAGESHKGIDTWYYLVNDNGVKQYYWGGGISVIDTPQEEAPGGAIPAEQPEITAEQPEAPAKQSFPWFRALQAEQIWSTYKTKGAGVTIAVLDTGYNTGNADVAAAVTASKLFFDDTDGTGVNDLVGHGTFCTSVAGARNNAAYNIGIAPACKILSGKISIVGEAPSTDTMLQAIQWAVNAGADIISISFSVDVTTPDAIAVFQAGFNNIIAGKNVLVFAASGDSASNAIVSKEVYPASLNGCISVGASDGSNIAAVTIRSPKTVIHAQGMNVAAYQLDATPQPMDGTSVSVPIVAGIAALAVSYIKSKNNNTWSAADLLQKIYNTGTPIAGTTAKKIINPLALFNQL